MSKKLMQLKNEFIEKQERLENARIVLKIEFFGIDRAIDELVNNTRSWYVLNSYQNRPLVVNLWGLTGVGKTSLVTRLAELISFDNRLFRFDLGAKFSSHSFRSGLDDLCGKEENQPLIIVLDEFQHSRTLTGPHKTEIKEDDNRKVWELIDSGKIEYYNWNHKLHDLIDYTNQLKHLINAGVTVTNGNIVKGILIYKSEMEEDYDWDDRKKDNRVFVDPSYYSTIIELAGKDFGFKLIRDVKNYIMKLDGPGTIDFLMKVLMISKKPRIKNFTKALIFIIGNLDEAYNMSDNLTADIDADIFYESSLKINIQHIKNALAQRFRIEQVARLGNIHIIYPALNRFAYESIIKNEFKKIEEKAMLHLDIKINLDDTVLRLIYKEGVFPTQGTRPLLSSISYLIKNNLPLFFAEILLKDIKTNLLKFSIQNNELCCSYFFETKIVNKKSVSILTPLEDSRKSKKDDIQAITAVHESGHAILSAILLLTIPQQVVSVSTDLDSNGFVFTKLPWKYVSKKQIVNQVAMILGGRVAEELIFGEDYITEGANGDIKKATLFVTEMYKKCGMFDLPIAYAQKPEKIPSDYRSKNKMEMAIKKMIADGFVLARTALKKEIALLLVMADYLSDNSFINKPELKALIEMHKVSEVKFIENADLLYYRAQLKSKITPNLSEISKRLFETINLNHEKKE